VRAAMLHIVRVSCRLNSLAQVLKLMRLWRYAFNLTSLNVARVSGA